MKYNIVSNEGARSSVTVFVDGAQYIATKEHPHFNEICEAVTTGSHDAEQVKGLFDVTLPLAKKFHALSERVSVGHGRVYFDLEPVNDTITTAILAFHAEGNDNFKPLVNFMEKIAMNPNPHSREHLYRWMMKHHFGITPDGDIIAYKGVTTGLFSVNAGKGVVNGDLVNGKLQNKPGTIIEMPRGEVTFDPRQGCSTGLHVGNWKYASTFATITLMVKVNPRDVVSVPSDSNDQKMRVCRYKVMDRVTSEDKSAFYPDNFEKTAKLVVKSVPKHDAAEEEPTSGDWPTYYEEFTKADYERCTMQELRWVVKEFDLTGITTKTKKDDLIKKLLAEGKRRRATW